MNKENWLTSMNIRHFNLITKFCRADLDLGFLAMSEDFNRLGNSF